jgi:hypothetical protein
MPRKAKVSRSDMDQLWNRWIEQLPTIASLLWDEGEAKDAASHAVELVEACMAEVEGLER